MTASCILVAAGKGQRLGAGLPKALVDLGGKPLLLRAVAKVIASELFETVVIVYPPGHETDTREIVAKCATGDTRIVFCPGGAERQNSVYCGIQQLGSPDSQHAVLIHDVARCETPIGVFRSVYNEITQGAAAAVPVLPVVDSLRRVTGGVVDRETLRVVQTPQGFQYGPLVKAHETCPPGATDDASLVEQSGYDVRLVPGDRRAMKVTEAADLTLLNSLIDEGTP